MSARPPMTVQMDLDGLRIINNYLSGTFAEGQPDPLVLSGLQVLLDMADELDFKVTLFAVGQDLADPALRALVCQAVDAGHEVANHTYTHPHDFPTLAPHEQAMEVIRGEEAILAHTGVRPVGFRSPAYVNTPPVSTELRRHHYLYDATRMPSGVVNLLPKVTQVLLGKRSRFLRAGNTAYTTDPFVLSMALSVMPFLSLPLNGTFALRLPTWLVVAATHTLAVQGRPFHFLLHPVDLAPSLKGYGLPRWVQPPGSQTQRIRRVRRYISRAMQWFDPMTGRDAAVWERVS